MRRIDGHVTSALVVLIAGSVHLPPAQAALSTNAYAAPALAAQTNRESGVSVTVTPRSLAPGAPSWDFEVTLETHTQALNQDMTKAAALIDAQGRPHAPLGWDGDPPGGHHRRGVLRFRPLAANPAAVELRLQGIGGVEARVFRWLLR